MHYFRALLYLSRYERPNIFEETRSGHVVCNVWGWISIHGVGAVTRMEGRFTAQVYLRMLQDVFLPSLQERNFPFPDGPVIFVHDRCPVHTARAVREWFTGQDHLQLLEWPSKGCDCNPIENIWANMVNTWETEQERTAETLMAHVNRVWEGYRNRPHLVRNIVSSMPERLREVIEKQGGWTHY